jgi:hypothetical protein
MKQGSLCKNAANLTQLLDSSYKQTSRPGVSQINSVNLNLTVSIKTQILERYWALLASFCRYIEHNIG